MNEAERLVLSKMLSLLTEEQRDAMIESILAESGRDKFSEPTVANCVEDEAIRMIEAGFFDRY